MKSLYVILVLVSGVCLGAFSTYQTPTLVRVTTLHSGVDALTFIEHRTTGADKLRQPNKPGHVVVNTTSDFINKQFLIHYTDQTTDTIK